MVVRKERRSSRKKRRSALVTRMRSSGCLSSREREAKKEGWRDYPKDMHVLTALFRSEGNETFPRIASDPAI